MIAVSVKSSITVLYNIARTARIFLNFFFHFSVWVNDSLPSTFTIIKHIKGKVLSFLLLKVLVYETNAHTSDYLLYGFSV